MATVAQYRAAPIAAVGLDYNRDVKTDAFVVGTDLNRDRIPDALQTQAPPVQTATYTFDVGGLNPALASTWAEYLRGQQGSWEKMVRQHGEVKNEISLLETKNRAMEQELLALQRQINENDVIIKAGGRLQPTKLQQPSAAPMAVAGIDVNREGRADVLVVGYDRNRDRIPDALPRPSVPTVVSSPFVVGEHVMAKYPDGKMYGATVEEALSDGTYRVRWDDGDANYRLKRADEIWKGTSYTQLTSTVGYQAKQFGQPPLAMAGVDMTRDGRTDAYVVGSDRNQNGIPDARDRPLAQTVVPAQRPLAVVGVDVNRDGRTDASVVGSDRNRNAIPDALDRPLAPTVVPAQPPLAVVGLDLNANGKPDYVVGADYNRDNILDASQQQPPLKTPMATVGLDTDLDGKTDVVVTGPDRNEDGIQDQMQGDAGFSWLPKDTFANPVEMFRLEQAINIHPSQVHSVAMHENNQLVATASWDSTVKLFDLSAKSVVKTFGDSGDCQMAGLYSVAFSKTNPDILGCTSADQNVYIWNYRTGKLESVLTGHANEVNGIDFHPTQEVLATASDDCTCIIWDVAEKSMLRTLDDHTRPVYGCVFMGAENQYCVATCSFDHNMRVFDMRKKDLVFGLQTHQDDITGIDYASSKQRIATGSDDGKISIVCVREQKLLTQIDVRLAQPDNEVKRVKFSPCGSLLAAACSSGKVLVYNVDESPATQVAVLGGHADCVFDVAWGVSPSGAKMIVSASHDHSCGHWMEVL